MERYDFYLKYFKDYRINFKEVIKRIVKFNWWKM